MRGNTSKSHYIGLGTTLKALAKHLHHDRFLLSIEVILIFRSPYRPYLELLFAFFSPDGLKLNRSACYPHRCPFRTLLNVPKPIGGLTTRPGTAAHYSTAEIGASALLWPTESSTANFVFLATRLLTLLSSIADFVLNLDWAGWSPTNQIMDESHSEKPRLGGFALGSSSREEVHSIIIQTILLQVS